MEDGTEPVKDFIHTLDAAMYAKAMYTIELLKARGHLLRPPYSKELDDGIMELRISAGNNISRILYFFVIGNTAILTNGFIKKTWRPQKSNGRNSTEKTTWGGIRNDYMGRVQTRIP